MDRESIMGVGFSIKMRPAKVEANKSEIVVSNKSTGNKKRDSRGNQKLVSGNKDLTQSTPDQTTT